MSRKREAKVMLPAVHSLLHLLARKAEGGAMHNAHKTFPTPAWLMRSSSPSLSLPLACSQSPRRPPLNLALLWLRCSRKGGRTSLSAHSALQARLRLSGVGSASTQACVPGKLQLAELAEATCFNSSDAAFLAHGRIPRSVILFCTESLLLVSVERGNVGKSNQCN